MWTFDDDERRAIRTTSMKTLMLGPLIWPYGLRGLHSAILKATAKSQERIVDAGHRINDGRLHAYLQHI